VTPDVLFNENGQLKLAIAMDFQRNLWADAQEFVTNVSNAKYGHAMTTQPISFITSSFSKFREWITINRGKCYEEMISRVLLERGRTLGLFCAWCQFNVFIEHTNVTGYDVHSIEYRPDVYVRFGMHVPYEAKRWGGHTYHSGSEVVISGGLCLWFGESVFPFCKHKNDPFLHKVFWTYSFNITQHVSAQTKNQSIAIRQARLAAIVEYLRARDAA
jgi:hypothetical protein